MNGRSHASTARSLESRGPQALSLSSIQPCCESVAQRLVALGSVRQHLHALLLHHHSSATLRMGEDRRHSGQWVPRQRSLEEQEKKGDRPDVHGSSSSSSSSGDRHHRPPRPNPDRSATRMAGRQCDQESMAPRWTALHDLVQVAQTKQSQRGGVAYRKQRIGPEAGRALHPAHRRSVGTSPSRSHQKNSPPDPTRNDPKPPALALLLLARRHHVKSSSRPSSPSPISRAS